MRKILLTVMVLGVLANTTVNVAADEISSKQARWVAENLTYAKDSRTDLSR